MLMNIFRTYWTVLTIGSFSIFVGFVYNCLFSTISHYFIAIWFGYWWQNNFWLYPNQRKKTGSLLSDCNCALPCAMVDFRFKFNIEGFNRAPNGIFDCAKLGLGHGRCCCWRNDSGGSKRWQVSLHLQFLIFIFCWQNPAYRYC